MLIGLLALSVVHATGPNAEGPAIAVETGVALEFVLVPSDPGAPSLAEQAFAWRAPSACTAWIWCRSFEVDPLLEVVRNGQPPLADDNGGDGTTALIRIDVAADEGLVIRARGAAGRCELQVAITQETEATRALHEEVASGLARVNANVDEIPPEERARWLADSARALLEADPDGRSLLVAEDLWKLAGALYDVGDLQLSLRAYQHVEAQRERRLPQEHRQVQRARLQRAMVLQELGDVKGSVEIKRAAIAILERTLPQSQELLIARANLAAGLGVLGHMDEGIEQLRAILDTDVEHLPADHALRTMVRGNLGEFLMRSGNLAGARDLCESNLRDAERTLGAESAQVGGLRLNLAMLCAQIGECTQAREHLDLALASLERQLAPDALPLWLGRMRAAQVSRSCGDLVAARDLAERTIAAIADRLPPDDADLRALRELVAMTFAEQGDFLEARDRLEAELALVQEQLPPGSRGLENIRINLSNVLSALGDSQGARSLLELAIEGLEGTVEPGHPDLAVAQMNLAAELKRQGDPRRSLELEEKALASLDDMSDPRGDLRARLRVNMSSTRQDLGQTEPAEELLSEALVVLAREPERQASFLHVARFNLALLRAARGDLSGARTLLEQDLAAAAAREEQLDIGAIETRAQLASIHAQTGSVGPLAGEARRILADIEHLAARSLLHLSVREADNLARALRTPLQRLVACTGTTPMPELDLEILRVDQLLREIPIARAASLRRALAVENGGETGQRLAALATRITQLAHAPDSSADLAAAVLERARLEREVLVASPSHSVASSARVDLDCVRELLGTESACVSFLTTHEQVPGSSTNRPANRQRLWAFVLRASGPPSRIDLGPWGPIEAAIEAWRSAIGGVASARGLAAVDSVPSPHSEHAAGARLRALVLDPLAMALEGARTLHLTLDGMLARVPLDALPEGPEDGDAVVGDRWTIELHESLLELCQPALANDGRAQLVALGDVAYGSNEFDPDLGATVWTGDGRTPGPTFPALPATRIEIDRLAEMWPGSKDDLVILTGARASEPLLRAAAPQARYLHLATHGWTAPEELVRAADESLIRDGITPLPADVRDRARMSLCPLSFCGLALAGITAGGDAHGRRAGALNGEELASWDLSGCALATFSACESALGTYRTGRAADGLQRAARIAGARQALCSLWPVPDAATAELMTGFYEGLWKEGLAPARALWRAKETLRSRLDADGRPVYGTAAWAGWTLWGAEP